MHYAVIMAGGSGQRLWPLSREHRPKQIINIFAEQSLLRLCVNRVRHIFDPEHILVVTNAEYAAVVREHLPDLPAENVLGEPMGRNTANAIGLAATVLKLKSPEAVMAVFSADQIIEPVAPLAEAIREALSFIESHPTALFTFGIKARYAHTGLGYLKRGSDAGQDGIFSVAAFKEKPNKSTAHKYIRSGKYCWNSGMFVWRVDTILQQLECFLPHNAERLRRIGQAWQGESRDEVLQQEFGELENISIDFAVMERAQEVYMCELDCHWEDVGSYQTLADNIGAVDQDDNVTTPETRCEWLDCQNNIAISESPDHLIAAVHVEDLIIVHTPDATLICRRDETDRLREMLGQLKDKGHERYL
ncbi:MAG: hypothetical protein AMJ79_11370 [Phycisphaerae bacterium SM23_30]|nr:MAG: hypothetical protein AMJ79_11370 [Phycisphaerae bacterium SM23_30]